MRFLAVASILRRRCCCPRDSSRARQRASFLPRDVCSELERGFSIVRHRPAKLKEAEEKGGHSNWTPFPRSSDRTSDGAVPVSTRQSCDHFWRGCSLETLRQPFRPERANERLHECYGERLRWSESRCCVLLRRNLVLRNEGCLVPVVN
jgi:hypothetical protein